MTQTRHGVCVYARARTHTHTHPQAHVEIALNVVFLLFFYLQKASNRLTCATMIIHRGPRFQRGRVKYDN